MAKKKAHLVMSRNAGVLETGIKTGKGTLKFQKGKTAMFVSDPELVKEIDQTSGLKGSGDVWVAQDERAESFLRDDSAEGRGIHRYFWGASPKYANAWEEFEKRRKDKKK